MKGPSIRGVHILNGIAQYDRAILNKSVHLESIDFL